jgi:hypothetical protein
MHGTDDKPSNLAASSLESPSTTTLSLPMRRGTLETEPANGIRDFANVRWIILAEFAHVRFQGDNGAGLDPKRRKDVVAAGPPARFFRFRMPCGCLPA